MSVASKLPPLADIVATVAGGHVPDAHALVSLDRDALDAILDARDAPSFAVARTRASSAVEMKWDALAAPAYVRGRVEEVRRTAFLAVGNVTGRHDLASEVSDDFGMIAKAAAAGVADPFLRSLWELYEGGTYPGLSDV